MDEEIYKNFILVSMITLVCFSPVIVTVHLLSEHIRQRNIGYVVFNITVTLLISVIGFCQAISELVL